MRRHDEVYDSTVYSTNHTRNSLRSRFARMQELTTSSNQGNQLRRYARRNYSLLAFFVLVGAVIVVSLITIASDASNRSDGTLRFVSVLFRHGQRTPTDFYPSDPFKDISYWPEGLGALTKEGKLEAYNLGKWLKLQYKDFIPDLYTPEDIYVLSSDHDRCLMSAQLCLAGLYPPREIQVWNEDLLWQPIPVHTTPRNLDQLIVVKKPCPLYDSEFARMKTSLNVTLEEKKLYEYLTSHAGKPIPDVFAAELLHNTLEIEDHRGLKLPSWTNSVYPNPLKNMSLRSLTLYTGTAILKKLKGGPLIKDISNNMERKAAHSISQRLFLYSAHDLTLVSVLNALGVKLEAKPEPTAALIFELHKDLIEDDYFVEIYYKYDSRTSEKLKIDLTDCTPPCRLVDFIAKTKEVTPVDWDEECHSQISLT